MYRGYGRQFARKRDANDSAIAAQARECGFHLVEWGASDYLVEVGGVWIPTEVKNLEGRAYGRKKQLTSTQVKLRELAQASGAPFLIWYTQADVIQTWASIQAELERDRLCNPSRDQVRSILRAVNAALQAIERRTEGAKGAAGTARKGAAEARPRPSE